MMCCISEGAGRKEFSKRDGFYSVYGSSSSSSWWRWRRRRLADTVDMIGNKLFPALLIEIGARVWSFCD